MNTANILVAEDEFIVASDIKLRLKSLGYTVLDIVSTGEDVIKKTFELQPDLILMDVMLQGKVDGIEAAITIHKTYDTPIIFLTASTDESTLNRAKDAEPYGFILKPFEARELHSTIEIAFYRYQMETKLKESEERFKALVENSSDAVALIDMYGNIIFATNSTKRILGYSVDDFIGKNIIEFIFPDDLKNIQELLKEVLSKPNKTIVLQARAIHKNGNIRWMESTSTNLLHIPSINAIVSNFRDITERKEYEEEIKKSHARSESLVNSNIVGITITDLQGNILESNDRFLELTGYTRKDLEDNNIGWRKITPVKFKKIDDKINKELLEKGYCQPFEKEYIKKDGTVVPVLIGATKLKESDNLYVCFILDIAERKLIENNLLETNETLKTLIQASPLGIVAMSPEVDPKKSIVNLWNPAAEKIFGWKTKEIINKPFPIVPKDAIQEAMILRKSILEGNIITNYEVKRIKKNGELVDVSLSSSVIKDKKGKPTSLITLFADITESKKIESKMHYLSFYDQMTGLPNKDLFYDRLNLAIAGAKRNSTKVGILFIDLDHFKNINDEYGHEVGDNIIKELADRFTNSIRETDTVSRRTGDEFIILLPDIISVENIEKVISKLFEDIKEPILYKRNKINITVSIGISIFPDNGENMDVLITQADIAMYNAKNIEGFSHIYYKKNMKIKK